MLRARGGALRLLAVARSFALARPLAKDASPADRTSSRHVVELTTPTPTPTPNTIRSWGAAEVAKWALTIRSIDDADAAILEKNKITGEDLLDRVTKADLVAVGMSLGPAGRRMSALAAVKPVEAPVVPASTGEHG